MNNFRMKIRTHNVRGTLRAKLLRTSQSIVIRSKFKVILLA